MATKKVLIVDDSPAQLSQLREIVKAQGCQIIEATSGREAVDKAIAENPDLIFLDIIMDDLDGYGACREILNNSSTENIPIVFVSTKKQRADKLWAARQGAKDLISKPYENQEIIDAINKY
jgi:twitching motility two-component system response regulator PilH